LSWAFLQIESRARENNLTLRSANFSDFENLLEFVESNYIYNEGNNLSAYDYYQIFEYGQIIILLQNNLIVGCIFLTQHRSVEKTTYALRLVITPKLRGQGIAEILTDYACCVGMLKGSSVIRATIYIHNIVSLYFNLNKIGMILETINEPIKGLNRLYQASLPLYPNSLIENKISRKKLQIYLENHRPEVDYKLIDTQNIPAIETMFYETNFKVVAIHIQGKNTYSFVAIPADKLQFFSIKHFNASKK
jgi:hypothetical protein